MAQTSSRRRLVRALALPFLVALGLTASSCASDKGEESEGPAIKNVKQLVYAVRQTTSMNEDGTYNVHVADGEGQVLNYDRFVPGGRLEIFNLSTGNAENIISDFKTADISGLDLNFEGTKVVFSMNQNGSD